MFDSCDPMDCSPPGSSVHGISQQEYWSGLPFPPPGGLPDPGIEPMSPALQAESLPSEAPSQVALVVKNPSANAEDLRDAGSMLGSGRSPGEGHGNSLQYSGLENPMDRGAWWATVHRDVQSRTRLKRLSTHAHELLLIFGRVLAGFSLLRMGFL